MIDMAGFMGGAQEKSFGANASVDLRLGRLVTATATTTGLELTVKTSPKAVFGAKHGWILNVGVNDFDLVDEDGDLIVTIPDGYGAVLGLFQTSPWLWLATLMQIA